MQLSIDHLLTAAIGAQFGAVIVWLIMRNKLVLLQLAEEKAKSFYIELIENADHKAKDLDIELSMSKQECIRLAERVRRLDAVELELNNLRREKDEQQGKTAAPDAALFPSPRK